MSGEAKAATKSASEKRGGGGGGGSSRSKSKKKGAERSYPPSLRADDDNGLGMILENEQSPKKQEENTIRNVALELDCPVYLHQQQPPTTPSSRRTDDDGKRERKSALSSEARTLLKKNLLLESSSTHLSPKKESLANKDRNLERPRDKKEVKCDERNNNNLVSPHQTTPTKLKKLRTDAATIKSPHKDCSRTSSLRKENDLKHGYSPKVVLDKAAEKNPSKQGEDAPERPHVNVDVKDGESKEANATQDEKLKTTLAAEEAAEEPISPVGRLSPRTRRRTVCNPAVVAATSTRHLGSTTRRAGRTTISSTGNKSMRHNSSTAQHYSDRSKGANSAAEEPGPNTCTTSQELTTVHTDRDVSKQSKVQTHPKQEAKATTSSRTSANRNRNMNDTKDPDSPKQRNQPARTGSGRTPRSPARAQHRKTLKQGLLAAATDNKNAKGLPSASSSSHSRTSKSSVQSCQSAVSVTTSSGLIW